MYSGLQFRHSLVTPLAGWLLVVCLTGSAFAQKYTQTNLVSDIPGLAALTDARMVNAWGIANGPTSPFWINQKQTLDKFVLLPTPLTPTKVML